MKLLFFQWNAFMQRGIANAMKKLNISYDTYHYIFKDWDNDDEFVEKFAKNVRDGGYDTVFSVNFSPLIAEVCNDCGVRYISWVYDCPMNIRRVDTIGLPCNEVYFFDRVQKELYESMGMNTVHHLPLAVDTELFKTGTSGYDCDVSLLGQLYKSDFGYLCGPLDQYSRGFLEGVVQAQLQLSGGYVIHELINDDLMDMLNKQYHKASGGTFKVLPAELEYALACEATGRERFMALALLQNRCDVRLYSNDANEALSKVKHMGYADYYSKMPSVFAKSKINLNISLSAIQSGIPLRILDIMGSGGFVITNLQPELFEYFEPGYDIVIYENMKDLVGKVLYYLDNEAERKEIAKRGFEKVKEFFSFEDRIRRMFKSNVK